MAVILDDVDMLPKCSYFATSGYDENGACNACGSEQESSVSRFLCPSPNRYPVCSEQIKFSKQMK